MATNNRSFLKLASFNLPPDHSWLSKLPRGLSSLATGEVGSCVEPAFDAHQHADGPGPGIANEGMCQGDRRHNRAKSRESTYMTDREYQLVTIKRAQHDADIVLRHHQTDQPSQLAGSSLTYC